MFLAGIRFMLPMADSWIKVYDFSGEGYTEMMNLNF